MSEMYGHDVPDGAAVGVAVGELDGLGDGDAAVSVGAGLAVTNVAKF